MFRKILILLLVFDISGMSLLYGATYSKKEEKAIQRQLLRNNVVKKKGRQYYLTSGMYYGRLFDTVNVLENKYSDSYCMTTVQLDSVYASFCFTDNYKFLFTFPEGSYGSYYKDGVFITKSLPISWYRSDEGATNKSGGLIFEPKYDAIIVLAENMVAVKMIDRIVHVYVVDRDESSQISYELMIPYGLTTMEWTGNPEITVYLKYSTVDDMYPETTRCIQDRDFSLGIYYSLNCMWPNAIESFKKVIMSGSKSMRKYSEFNINQLEHLVKSGNTEGL